MIKVTHTASPVQLDEVLTALQSDTRQDLKDVLDGLADGAQRASRRRPTTATPHPSARGETGAESFNDAYVDIPAAERSTAQVFEAFLGQEPGEDLSRLIDGTARTTGALIRNEEQLKDLITNFNRTTAAFAVGVGQPADLDPRARRRRSRTPTRALASLNAAFPPTRAFAREILPGVRETPATIEASFPWIAQTRQLVSPQRARRPRQGALAGHARPRAPDRRARSSCCPQTTLTSRCARQVLLPTGDIVIKRRVRDRRRELQGVLLGPGRPRRRGPELRRQRHVRALPARRRLAGRLAGHRRRRLRRGVRQQRRRAARQPPVLSRQAPAVPARRAVPHQQAARPQRAGRREDRARPRRPPSRARDEDGDPQAPRGLRGDHRPDPGRRARRRR